MAQQSVAQQRAPADAARAARLSANVGRHEMQRLNLTAMHRKAAENLEDSLRHFDDAPSGLAREFVDLKLQACIFQYDVCTEMISSRFTNTTAS